MVRYRPDLHVHSCAVISQWRQKQVYFSALLKSVSAQRNVFNVLGHWSITNSTELWTQRMAALRSANRLLTRLIWTASHSSQHWFDFTQHTSTWWGTCVREPCSSLITPLLSFLLCWREKNPTKTQNWQPWHNPSQKTISNQSLIDYQLTLLLTPSEHLLFYIYIYDKNSCCSRHKLPVT